MKKTRLKKQSKKSLPTLKRKIDRAYQDFFRELCWDNNIGSQVSGKKMDLCHHAEEKSQCAALEFDERNFVPLTKQEHDDHTLAGKNYVMGIVNAKRGEKWVKAMSDIRYKNKGFVRNAIWYAEKMDYLEKLKLRRQELVENYNKVGYFSLNENLI